MEVNGTSMLKEGKNIMSQRLVNCARQGNMLEDK